MSDRDPSQERLNELFEYKDGKLYNKTTRCNRAMKGAESGYKRVDGYRAVRIARILYLSHRLIYTMHNGDIEKGLFIDHIDGDKTNNRIDNLRVVTNQENTFNSSAKGYCWNKDGQYYQAEIMVGGKRKRLGTFSLEEDAAEAYRIAKKELHIIEER